MNILVPFDGSPCALRALDEAIRLAAALAAPPVIHVLHVHLPIPLGRIEAQVGTAALQAYYREEGEAVLALARQRLEASELHYLAHLHVGQAAEVIVHQAGVLACDWILMGSHGRTGLASLLMGSVASKVLHLSTCPLLLVK